MTCAWTAALSWVVDGAVGALCVVRHRGHFVGVVDAVRRRRRALLLGVDAEFGAVDSVQPAQRLTSQFGDKFKVFVAMQNRESQSFGNGCE